MSKNKNQGTDWERNCRDTARALGIPAMYLRPEGSNDMGDVWVNQPPATLGKRIAVLAWKRIVDLGKGRRVPLGEREVFVVDGETFWEMLRCTVAEHPDLQVVLECKAAQALSATRTLHDAKQAAGHTGIGYDGLEAT